ncbi:ROK family protein [Antarcticibacterium flavum]|uniref:ROK family protein n=1 Tax=Antarcticibacterium flavum TaxID=2058175 RepID=A0A5B7X2M4_9FLAO|nr:MULTISPECIES: ROK family protein [Antarcticibacterium]MCM4160103.1 sugar kinase [Antarcticibacterium sp. W02-3]QCY69657.1 ROK family protein [Antarcticibacterium flavum]
MEEVLGVDIGGTSLKTGRVKNGAVDGTFTIAVERAAASQKTLEDLYRCIEAVITENTTKIGIGVPAVVDPVTGIVYDVQNIPAWKKIALKDIIEDRFALPVTINNDANCFALGEKIYGQGRDFNNFIGLSLGTGIGMGIIINGHLYNGVLCGAGEVGMLPYKDGILEDYTGSFFFSSHYNATGEELFRLAAKGEKTGIEAFTEYGRHLGEAIKSILYLFSPEAVILEGAISNAFPYFINPVNDSLKSFAYQKQLENFKLINSNLHHPGILGAAALCFED